MVDTLQFINDKQKEGSLHPETVKRIREHLAEILYVVYQIQQLLDRVEKESENKKIYK